MKSTRVIEFIVVLVVTAATFLIINYINHGR
jgi:hypothetical protein